MIKILALDSVEKEEIRRAFEERVKGKLEE